jgi:hypothetical protein
MEHLTPANDAPVAQAKPRRIRRGTKFASVLTTLLQRGSLNCFEAVRLCHDYVLRSTVASLRREYGFQFLKQDESVPGHGGASVYCTRYSLTPEDRALALELLGDDLREAA